MFCEIVSEDEVTQRKGVVFIMDTKKDVLHFQSTVEEREDNRSMQLYNPARWSGFHLCLPNGPTYHMIRTLIVLILDKDLRARVRFYEGMTLETRYRLMTFGIPVSEIPVSDLTGTLKNKAQQQFIKTRIAIERIMGGDYSSSRTSTFITHPGSNDVLFLKGGKSNQHQGNLRCQQLVESKLQAYYSKPNRTEGKVIRDEIIHTIREENGRFLELDREGGWWVEITDENVLHTKISTMVYYYNKRLTAKARQQTSKSDTVRFLAEGGNNKLSDPSASSGCFGACTDSK